MEYCSHPFDNIYVHRKLSIVSLRDI